MLMPSSQELSSGPAAGCSTKLRDLPHQEGGLLAHSALSILCPHSHLLPTARVPSRPCLLPASTSTHLVLAWPPFTYLQLGPYSLPKHRPKSSGPVPSYCPDPSLVQSRYLLRKAGALYSHTPAPGCWLAPWAVLSEHQRAAWGLVLASFTLLVRKSDFLGGKLGTSRAMTLWGSLWPSLAEPRCWLSTTEQAQVTHTRAGADTYECPVGEMK